MAKGKDIVIRMACHSASKQRGGTESVVLVPLQTKANTALFRGHPQGSFNFVIDVPEGQGQFDPDKDYEVTFRAIEPEP